MGPFLSLLLIGGCGRIGTTTQSQKLCFATSPGVVALSLGEVNARGRKIQKVIAVRNRVPHTLTIGTVKTSCECVRVTFDKPVVAPSEDRLATIDVDLSDDRAFSGSLAVHVDVFADNAVPILSLVVRFEVPTSGTVGVDVDDDGLFRDGE